MDIARDSAGLIWAALDDSELPLCCYDPTGTVVGSIGNDVISSADGVAIDSEGFLWISDNQEQLLCRIDISEL